MTQLLHAWHAGDPTARDELLSLIYDDLSQRARYYLRNERGQTLQTGDLVHEVYFRFAGCDEHWEGRDHFFAIVAKKMREFLVDHARARNALKRGGGLVITGLTGHDVEDDAPLEVLVLHDALKDLQQFDPRKASILEMRYFGGMGNLEIARHLKVSESTVERELRLSRAWLKVHMGPTA